MVMLAKDIMTPDIKSVSADWSLQRFAAFLTDNSISGCAVVDADQHIIGIASLSDIADFHLNEIKFRTDEKMAPEVKQEVDRMRQFLFEDMAGLSVEVRDIMSPALIAVDQDTPVTVLAQKMIEANIHRIFISCDDEYVGIVTTFDIVKFVAEREPQELESHA